MVSAFQQNGFQLNAFQIAFETEWAFQKCAFQFGAFQVEQCDTAWVYHAAPRGPRVEARDGITDLSLRYEPLFSTAAFNEATEPTRTLLLRERAMSGVTMDASIKQEQRVSVRYEVLRDSSLTVYNSDAVRYSVPSCRSNKATRKDCHG